MEFPHRFKARRIPPKTLRNRYLYRTSFFIPSAATGAFLINGVAAGVIYSPTIAAGPGSYVISPQSANITVNLNRWVSRSLPTGTWTARDINSGN